MKRQMVSIALYSPYPGSILGHQLIAEGKSLMSKEQHDRNPNSPKVKGIDYAFYNDLCAGKYNAEVAKVVRPTVVVPTQDAPVSEFRFSPAHHFYLFALKNGKRRSSYGDSPQAALDVLHTRLTPEEIAEIIPDDYIKTSQQDMRQYIPVLG
jgi:hypothetical protein